MWERGRVGDCFRINFRKHQPTNWSQEAILTHCNFLCNGWLLQCLMSHGSIIYSLSFNDWVHNFNEFCEIKFWIPNFDPSIFVGQGANGFKTDFPPDKKGLYKVSLSTSIHLGPCLPWKWYFLQCEALDTWWQQTYWCFSSSANALINISMLGPVKGSSFFSLINHL